MRFNSLKGMPMSKPVFTAAKRLRRASCMMGRALHDVVFGFVCSCDDFFGDTEGGADFGTGEFAMIEELHVGTGELGFDDLGAAD